MEYGAEALASDRRGRTVGAVAVRRRVRERERELRAVPTPPRALQAVDEIVDEHGEGNAGTQCSPRPRGRGAAGSNGNPTTVVGRGDHATIRAMFEEFRCTGDRALRDRLVAQHEWIASLCCRRFSGRGEPMVDLEQVAKLGVVRAVERYDPSFDVHFATFAIPTVLGELRRHFRDTTWPLRVPRRAKELNLQLAAAIDDLQQDLGRTPRVEEVAERLGATVDDVTDAIEANMTYRPAPLVPAVDRDAFDRGGAEEAATLAADDDSYDRVETTMLVEHLLAALSPRERRIIELRFFEGRSQVDIGAHVGLSQVHVSRTLRSSLDRLHALLTAESG